MPDGPASTFAEEHEIPGPQRAARHGLSVHSLLVGVPGQGQPESPVDRVSEARAIEAKPRHARPQIWQAEELAGLRDYLGTGSAPGRTFRKQGHIAAPHRDG